MPEAFYLHAYDYLEKPLTKKRFFHVLDSIFRKETLTDVPKLSFTSNRVNHQLMYPDIVMVRTASSNYIEITDKNGNTYKTRMTFSSVQTILEKENYFLILLRGILVNMNYILRFEDNTCYLENDIIKYCNNNAVNALLNYYLTVAQNHDTKVRFSIHLPKNVNITDSDLCSIVGNILENALTACQEMTTGPRQIELNIRTLHDNKLCIVGTNTFNGKVRKKADTYLSTHRKGIGTGLTSISITAEKYGGFAQFSNSDTQFYSDIMIPL